MSKLSDLDKRLDAVKDREDAKRRSEAQAQGENRAWSMAMEFIGATVFGAMLGYWLDRKLGTGPWLLIVLLLTGFAAGTFNAVRYSRRAKDF